MTKHKIPHHLKGKIRDSIKQVILIDGIPEALYTIKESKTTIVKFNGKKYRFDIPVELINELRKLQTIEIEESVRTSKKFKSIPIKGLGNRTTIRAVNGNTHITVGGADESQLAERIEIIKEYLASLDIKSIERCHWTCTVDKAKPNTDYQYTHKQPEPEKPKTPVKSEMSEKTKSLHDIALKAIKEANV